MAAQGACSPSPLSLTSGHLRPWGFGASAPLTALCRGEVPERSEGAVSIAVVRASAPWVRTPPSPPLSYSEPEMRLPLGAFFFLFQRRLARISHTGED